MNEPSLGTSVPSSSAAIGFAAWPATRSDAVPLTETNLDRRQPRHVEEFEYALGDQITLVDIDRPGFVSGMSVDGEGQQFRVIYWHDGARKSVWVFSREIRRKV